MAFQQSRRQRRDSAENHYSIGCNIFHSPVFKSLAIACLLFLFASILKLPNHEPSSPSVGKSPPTGAEATNFSGSSSQQTANTVSRLPKNTMEKATKDDVSSTTQKAQALGGAFSYTISGKVQGVYFRKYTKQKAESLGLVGWVKNTLDGKVVGEVAGGTVSDLEEMKRWLESVGSPKSRIDSAIFHPLDSSKESDLKQSGAFVWKKT